MLNDPPSRTTIEVSIFGPGRGESVAVHLGVGRWIIVDSCRARSREIPVLSYLERIGVEVARDVQLVVATHAHSDHFAGIAEVFAACSSAKFVCSSALMSAEFIALTDIEQQDHAGLPIQAYAEYRKIFDFVESRENSDEDILEFAFPNKRLFGQAGPLISCSVTSLSPSSRAFRRAMRGIRKAMPLVDEPGSPRPLNANDFAVALWVEAGDKHILLGADLPKGSTGFGWQAVLAGPRPAGRASVYKVAHHGSVTGHRAGIWSELLTYAPIALLTPYRADAKTVPNHSERSRILALTSEAYITAPPVRTSLDSTLRKEISALGSLAQNVRVDDEVGQIRARSEHGEEKWQVELASPAERLRL